MKVLPLALLTLLGIAACQPAPAPGAEAAPLVRGRRPTRCRNAA